ncbi:migration and invasion-inhibitory protein [Protopterus annectens]|uniref:migration and invasion-inhibitory protein n=1 Tax=Protopterus annectens TaxID=7888 RepID=UPI001CFC3BE1|nr:migration and invasion-inhibitory protein [Protopterus annectens]
MSDFSHLETLRNQNKNLLNKLKVKQELLHKINKEAVLGERKTEQHGIWNIEIKSNIRQQKEKLNYTNSDTINDFVEGTGRSEGRDSVRVKTAGTSADARTALSSSAKGNISKCNQRVTFSDGAVLGREKLQTFYGTEKDGEKQNDVSVPLDKNVERKQEFRTSTPYKVHLENTGEKETWSDTVHHGHSKPAYHSKFLQSQHEQEHQRSDLEPVLYSARLMDEGNDRQKEKFVREMKKPKSILITPKTKESKKEPSHVTFQQEHEESRNNVWTDQPLLGYDWIAGLLDIDCSVAEKSQQYFSELQEFRQVNKEECIRMEYLEAEELDLSVPFTKQSDCYVNQTTEGHHCIHRYKINSRLFPVPLEEGASCPICRTPQAKVSTTDQPAYIRISIPRSTLLPPYKHKVHRRKSFDPTDSLALPSHCLAGWENAVPSSLPPPSSLDLQSSLERDKTMTSVSTTNLNTTTSRVMGNTISDDLFDISRLARYRLQKLDQQQRWSSRMPHSTNLPVH